MSCLNSARPHCRVSAAATPSKGKVVVNVHERKWQEIKPYMTNKYSDTSAARAVTYPWYIGFVDFSISAGEMRPVKMGTV